MITSLTTYPVDEGTAVAVFGFAGRVHDQHRCAFAWGRADNTCEPPRAHGRWAGGRGRWAGWDWVAARGEGMALVLPSSLCAPLPRMREVDLGCGKALLIKEGGEFYAMGHKCPHYGAPLVKGQSVPLAV